MRYFWSRHKIIFAATLSLIGIHAHAASSLPFLVITDIHLNKDKSPMQIMPSGYNPNNDLDLKTYQSLVKETSRAIKDNKITPPEFILLLGDLVGHEVKGQKINRIDFVEQNQLSVFRTLKHNFPDTPIINVFGNNDAYDQNYGNYSYSDDKTHQTYSVYHAMQKSGFNNGFLSSGALCNNQNVFPCLVKNQENKSGGYAVIKLKQKLELIVLNSVMFSTERALTEKAQHEIVKQLEFLKSTLKKAKDSHSEVVIAMHIPVGKNFYDGSYFWHEIITELFLDTIRPYAKTIIGILNGHTHMEEFKKIDLYGHIIGQYTTAGLSTSHGNLPSVKLFKLTQGDQWQLDSYQSYRFTQDKESNINIEKFYSFDQRYCQIHQSNSNCLRNITFEQIYPELTLKNPNYMHYKHTCSEQCFIIK
ncbi:MULTISPECIES: metallophosphoesterase [Cysteiniphilum]|uniref:metallophosphoesterase n=1 Tax=Cysteiniphilum TaxID=2056696 RepID=UPI00177DE906|nr:MULTISPECIES: metallophosphoesterase [Cysteiniphilum]